MYVDNHMSHLTEMILEYPKYMLQFKNENKLINQKYPLLSWMPT